MYFFNASENPGYLALGQVYVTGDKEGGLSTDGWEGADDAFSKLTRMATRGLG